MSVRILAAIACAAILGTGCAGDPNHDVPTGNDALPALPDGAASDPFFLSQTGLYADIEQKRVATNLRPFEPAYALWSDGAEKHRYLKLPRGTRIDTSDPDHWTFPVGTMLFKEFVVDGKRIETRLIARTGPGNDAKSYWMGAFVWNDDESDARFVPDGIANARETDHDVPKVKNCFTCHDGERGRVLGFSAVQQPHVPSEMVSDALSSAYSPPGDEVARAALGYLHANCGHCHNPSGSARPDTDMNLRLDVAAQTLEDTNTYRTAVAQRLQYFKDSSRTVRIVPGDPDQSGLLFRMEQRGPKTQMPPLATEFVDEDGIARVRAFIAALPASD